MESVTLNKCSNIPGKGLMNPDSHQQRIGYLKTFDINFEPVLNTTLKLDEVKNNIESFIGSIEIPIGIVGPLLMKNEAGVKQEIFGAVGTTEGALVASMCRGTKAINDSGGFKASMLYQKMVRTPMFTFETLYQAIEFEAWIGNNFPPISKVTKDYSNHADLLEIKSYVIGKIVHLKFIYSTGDASGQNMTTTCTWHACLWIEEHFNQQHSFPITRYVIDGNGASDKKVSYYSMQSGRGVHVISECFLANEAIIKHIAYPLRSF
jgi:hydroxymethylglutaryl-CoA reductase (NADPH)